MKYDFINTKTGEQSYESRLEKRFEKEMDDIYGKVDICGCKYSAGHALKKVDPVTYRCDFVDWLDANDWIDA